MENAASSAAEPSAGKPESLNRLPYRVPVLVEYGSVSKLTEGTGSHNGDSGQHMMTPPCL
jgi:hypothetical protein